MQFFLVALIATGTTVNKDFKSESPKATEVSDVTEISFDIFTIDRERWGALCNAQSHPRLFRFAKKSVCLLLFTASIIHKFLNDNTAEEKI